MCLRPDARLHIPHSDPIDPMQNGPGRQRVSHTTITRKVQEPPDRRLRVYIYGTRFEQEDRFHVIPGGLMVHAAGGVMADVPT